ncbi:MAG: hypothetical protein H7287_03515 [Thermoleophilia bacterium]|nr:hypothetical protein [Thermoleophilia bacterium]
MDVQKPSHPHPKTMLNKVPEVILAFWVIKILCTTVGETFADYLNDTLGIGLTNTTYVMAAALAVSLFFQFRLRRYVPAVYWLAVVLISVVGTLITDNLVENLGVTLPVTTVAFSIALALTFWAWYSSEKTLSIHSVVTTKRESFYWLTVLFTFALGTASGDLIAEKFALGYWKSALLVGAVIGLIYVWHRFGKLGAITAFWIAYILTRPLGASIGDYFSQARVPPKAALAAGDLGPADIGLGLGTTVTSVIFLSAILAVVVFLTMTKRDEITLEHVDDLPCPECDEEGHPVPGIAPVEGRQECVCSNGHRFTYDIHDGAIVE